MKLPRLSAPIRSIVGGVAVGGVVALLFVIALHPVPPGQRELLAALAGMFVRDVGSIIRSLFPQRGGAPEGETK